VSPQACHRPDKILYSTLQEAMTALRHMPARRKRGCYPYRCRPCGGWHLGRSRRRTRYGQLKRRFKPEET
jgi:hypothetical protein